MDYNILFDKGAGNKVKKTLPNQLTIEKDKKDKGLASLKKGQQITGMVIDVDKQVTLNFDGQKVTTSKDVLKNAIVGEMKTFEVVKASESEIELRLLDGFSDLSRKSFKVARVREADWESILDKKEQTVKRAKREKECKETKNKLEEINSKLTREDSKRIEQEGFPMESISVNGLYETLNRVKAGQAPKENMKKEKMSSFDKEAIANRLKEEDLPVTAENLQNISKALELSDTAAKMDDKAMQNLIHNEEEPTIENIYKAYYGGKGKNQHALSSGTWNELETQVKEVIEEAGYEVNTDNLEDAKWLLDNKLPLTEETFTYKKELDTIKASVDKDMVLDKIIEGMKNGINPKDVSLVTQKGTSPEQLISDINSIQIETIEQAVKEDSELTIKKLVTIEERLASGSKADETNSKSNAATDNPERLVESTEDNHYEEIKALRQLEEIRLKMTLEAATQLEKQGFKVDTQRLEKVVEALRDLEDSYYKELLREADLEASELSLQTLKETTQSLEKLKYIPSSTLGSTLSLQSIQTIPGLLSEGMRLQTVYAKAGEAYETLMTVPSSEYGDSIKKAFSNMDSLLTEMNIDNTEQNQRAVRILGYNQMEITKESISRVKAYDLQVTTLMQNLHPAVTVRMIKEGINPLELPINELNRTIDRVKEEQGISSEEKYSTYLRRLDKEDSLTQEERKAYIGVYRLLYNVDKSDGAALGAVIKADQEVTLDHLLTAVCTAKKGGLDAVVSDEFGTLQSISREKATIAEQLSAFTGGSGQQNEEKAAKENSVEEQTEYLARILKLIKDEISPDKLQAAGTSISQDTAARSSQAAAEFAPALSSDQGIWQTVKEVPVEKLLEQLRKVESTQVEEEVYAGKVQEIREAGRNSEQAIRFLQDFRIPSTPLNIMMANHVLSNGESPIKRLKKLQIENIVENQENSLKEMKDLSDTIIDKSSMNEEYEQLETVAKAALRQACSEEKIDRQRLAELKSMGQQMTFLRTLAGKEFYQIPIETDQGITNMNLTILRGAQASGKVSVTIGSDKLGNIKADFSLKEQVLKGCISSDSKSGIEEMQRCANEIEMAAKENDVTIKQLDFIVQRRENDTYSYQNLETRELNTSVRNDTERILYRLAKAIVQTVRLAENNTADKDSAVS